MLLPQAKLVGIVVLCFCWVTFAADAQDNEVVSISGTALMLDDATPHVAVVVQAVKPAPEGNGEPTVVATTLSDESGRYQFTNLVPGQYQIRCYTTRGYIYYRPKPALQYGEGPNESEDTTGNLLQVKHGNLLANIDFRIAPFKKGTWRTYTSLDGLASNSVGTIHRNPDGVMWFRTGGGGVSRYDGAEFVNFTQKDGLASDYVYDIYRDPDGVMWFGTTGGLSRYDERAFFTLTTADGLGHNQVNAIHHDPDGVLWFGTGSFGTGGGGLSRYDPDLRIGAGGKTFVNFTQKDGLASDYVTTLHRAPDGALWVGTAGGFGGRRGDGVSRYDPPRSPSASRESKDLTKGESKGRFVTLSQKDGLAHNWVWAIHGDLDGTMWFGTMGGLSRYDGKLSGAKSRETAVSVSDCGT